MQGSTLSRSNVNVSFFRRIGSSTEADHRQARDPVKCWFWLSGSECRTLIAQSDVRNRSRYP